MANISIRRLACLGVLTAAALCLSWLESLLPLALPVPGAKLGLGNIAVMIALFLLGPVSASGVMLLKCLLTCLLFGNFSSLFFSLCGGLLSLGIMCVLKLFAGRYVSLLGISVAGACLHNTGQILAASILTQSAAIFSYLPVLLLVSIPLGILTALVCYPVIRALEHNRERLSF